MIKHLCVIFSFSFIISSFGQGKKFKTMLDTMVLAENAYLTNYDEKTFFQIGDLREEINYLEIDHELLDACLFFCINRLRKKYRKSILIFNQDLYRLTTTYVHSNHSNNFDHDQKDLHRVSKAVNYFSNQKNFHAKQLYSSVETVKLMDMKGVYNYYFDKSAVVDDISEWGIYKGHSKNKNDTTKIKEEVSTLTYFGFCDKLSKVLVSDNRLALKSKAYSEVACSVLFDPKTIFRKKIPSVKIIFVYAGKRTALISNDDFDTSIYQE